MPYVNREDLRAWWRRRQQFRLAMWKEERVCRYCGRKSDPFTRCKRHRQKASLYKRLKNKSVVPRKNLSDRGTKRIAA